MALLVLAKIASLLDGLEPAIAAKGIRVYTRLGAVHSEITADPSELQQTLSDLFDMAIGQAPEGGRLGIFYLMCEPGGTPGCAGVRGNQPWGPNVHEIAVPQARGSRFACVLFQTRGHYLGSAGPLPGERLSSRVSENGQRGSMECDLVTIRYCPTCGASAFAAASAKAYRCVACGFTYFHNLAAAVVAVIRHEGRIAWTVRAQDPGRGMLDLPGGFADYGETLEAAVLREVREELGLAPGTPRYLFSAPNRYRYRDVLYHTLDAVFEFELPAAPAPLLTLDAEIAAVHWLAPEAVAADTLAFESVRATLTRLRARESAARPAPRIRR